MLNKNFTSLLASVPMGLNKEAAGVESPDEVQMEQDFGRMAYMFLKDRASGLVPYLLGFEIVEREEDGSKAVGIFGFKLGNDYYYVPAFFANGQIKGMDLLYSKATNMFMPLRESWINSIINKQTIALGDGVGNIDNLRRTFEQPRFDFLAVPPNLPIGTVPKVAEAIHSGFNTWNEMQHSVVDSFEKDAKFQEAWAGAIARLSKQPLPFDKTAENSELVEFLQNDGGPKAVSALMNLMASNHGFAKAAMTFYPTVQSLFVTQFDEKLKPVKQAAKIEVITQKTDYLDGKEKKRLVRDGFTIKDNREDPEKAEVYSTDYVKRFTSPTKSGLYDLLLREGKCTQAWVFMPSEAGKNKHCIVVEPTTKSYFMCEPSAIFVRGDEYVDGEDPFKAAIDKNDMEIGKTYTLIDRKGNASKPFEVNSVMAQDGDRIRVKVYWKGGCIIERESYGHDFETLGSRNRLSPSSVAAFNDKDYIEFANFDANRLTTSGSDTLVIPNNWKALELEVARNKADNYDAKQMIDSAFKPGSLTDLETAMSKNAMHKLTVESDGVEYHVTMDNVFEDGRGMNYKTAMVRLVSKYGLSVDDTETILKEAHDKVKARRLVKFGQFNTGSPTSNLVGYQMPAEPGQASGIDSFTGATTVMPQIDLMRGQTIGQTKPINSVQPGFNLGGEAATDMQAAGLAQQAANAGQKQVFDHAAIGGLAKVYDSSAVIDTYVPELSKALDRIGRILFLFYWKNEEFSNRYGSEDMSEMEDTLRGVFKSFGDLVLKLKQKSIEPGDEEGAVM